MNDQPTLFNIPRSPKNNNSLESDHSKNNYCKPRLNRAVRNQVEMVMKSIDDLLPKDHLARDVWRYVEGLNLSIVLKEIRSVEGNAGRPATDPKILLALWLYGTVKGIGSARLLEEYCYEHDAFKWLCGGVNVNYHTIS